MALLEAIKRVLWVDWDPIGVNGIASDDEYDSYAFRILAMIEAGQDEAEVGAYLERVAIEHMGLGGVGQGALIASDARATAHKIMSLRGGRK